MFANELLVCFLFPIHLGLHRVYHIFTTIIHEGAHSWTCAIVECALGLCAAAAGRASSCNWSRAAAPAAFRQCRPDGSSADLMAAFVCVHRHASPRRAAKDSVLTTTASSPSFVAQAGTRAMKLRPSSLQLSRWWRCCCWGGAPAPRSTPCATMTCTTATRPTTSASTCKCSAGFGGGLWGGVCWRRLTRRAAHCADAVQRPACRSSTTLALWVSLSHADLPMLPLRRTHWDRWCGTEHPKYRSDVSKHFSEQDSSSKAAAAATAAGAAASQDPSTPMQVRRVSLRGSPPGHAARAIVG